MNAGDKACLAEESRMKVEGEYLACMKAEEEDFLAEELRPRDEEEE